MLKQLLVLKMFLTALWIAGCASTPAPQTATPPPSAVTAPNTHKHVQEALHRQYTAWRGVPYRIGGNDRNGIDCSGFVHLTYKQALGLHVPRTTKLLVNTGKEISLNNIAPGDLVFFKTGFGKRHVGIYIGSGQFIHASTSSGVVKSHLKSPYWSKHYWTSRRVLRI
jgi:cell wall-associated NlpC family hydrolase